MKFKRKKPLPVEAIQFDGTEDSVLNILSMCYSSAYGRVAVIKCHGDEIVINQKTASVGDWVVKEGEHISVYQSDKFEILFEREKPNFATPTLADIA